MSGFRTTRIQSDFWPGSANGRKARHESFYRPAPGDPESLFFQVISQILQSAYTFIQRLSFPIWFGVEFQGD